MGESYPGRWPSELGWARSGVAVLEWDVAFLEQVWGNQLLVLAQGLAGVCVVWGPSEGVFHGFQWALGFLLFQRSLPSTAVSPAVVATPVYSHHWWVDQRECGLGWSHHLAVELEAWRELEGEGNWMNLPRPPAPAIHASA